jgi:hypothetical protein
MSGFGVGSKGRWKSLKALLNQSLLCFAGLELLPLFVIRRFVSLSETILTLSSNQNGGSGQRKNRGKGISLLFLSQFVCLHV